MLKCAFLARNLEQNYVFVNPESRISLSRRLKNGSTVRVARLRRYKFGHRRYFRPFIVRDTCHHEDLYDKGDKNTVASLNGSSLGVYCQGRTCDGFETYSGD